MKRLTNIVLGCVAGLAAVAVWTIIRPPPGWVTPSANAPTNSAESSAVANVAFGQDDLTDVLYDAPVFELTDADGKPFGSKDLVGKPYAVMFFFSECKGICPGMTSRMHDLQNQLKGTNVQIVSFTVDPVNDTPEKLAGHRAAIGADADRWHLLTGTPQQMMQTAAGFKMPYDAPVNHSGNFLLIDKRGKVRGIYQSTDVLQTKDINEAQESMNRMSADAKTLSEES